MTEAAAELPIEAAIERGVARLQDAGFADAPEVAQYPAVADEVLAIYREILSEEGRPSSPKFMQQYLGLAGELTAMSVMSRTLSGSPPLSSEERSFIRRVVRIVFDGLVTRR